MVMCKVFSSLLGLTILQGHKAFGQQAGFTYTASPPGACAPSAITFTNTTTGTPVSYTWNFGNGRTSKQKDPVITFTTAGTFNITLTAYYQNSTSNFSQQVTINPLPAADFSANDRISCKPYTVTFTNTTPGAVSSTWDFGDGTGINSTAATVQHAYTTADTFDVTLTTANAGGCTQTITKKAYIMIATPEVSLANNPTSGCIPFNAAFSVTTTNIDNDPVSTYGWNFGDGTSQITTIPSVNHNYTTAGSRDLGITITTQQGCTVTRAYSQLVRTGTPPTGVSFTATPGNVCAATPVRLLASATNANSYRWNFGDGATQEGVDYDISHNFFNTGSITVNMQAGNNGCYTSAAPVAVTVGPSVANFSYLRSCNNRMTFLFTNSSIGDPTDTYEWDFDDNTPVDNSVHPQHTYTDEGTYTIRLSVRNTATGCVNTIFKTIKVFQADFNTGVNTICRGTSVPFGVVHVPSDMAVNYNWRFGDGTVLNTTNADIIKAFPNIGSYTDTVIISYNDPAYCNDTVIKVNHVNVIAPVASFALSGLACEGKPVTISNTSVPSPNIPFTNWYWDLGNGTTATTENPPTTPFTASGAYNVKLVITDARNCKDSVTQAITINPAPFIKAYAPQTKICEGTNITLQAVTDAAVQWTPAYALSCTNCLNPVATPLRDTQYIVTATSPAGCTLADTLRLQVVPAVYLVTGPDTAVCLGNSVQLRAAGAQFYSWTSSAGSINGANSNMPIVTPPQGNTVYTVSATNDQMCPAVSTSVNVNTMPVPTLDAGRNQFVTVGSLIKLEATYSADVVKWEWSPATYIDCPTCPSTTAAPRQHMNYSMTVTNNVGCKKTDVLEVRLLCDQSVLFIPSGFTPNGDGQNDVFYIRGKGVNKVRYMRIFNRWGQEVFKRENFNIEDVAAGWNGTQNGKPVAADVYIYMIEAICDSNEIFKLKGNISLIR